MINQEKVTSYNYLVDEWFTFTHNQSISSCRLVQFASKQGSKSTFFITSFSFTKQNCWLTAAGKVICMLPHSIIWGTSVPFKECRSLH